MRERFTRLLGALIIVFAAAPAFAQTTGPAQSGEPAQQTQPPGEPTPTDRAAAAGLAAPVDPKTYQIGAGDILFVRVWREPDLTGPVVVRPDGMFTLPLVGEIKASNLTPDQLKISLVEALNKFITKPEVMVSVQTVLSKKYYITGEVQRTGSFPLVVPTTILEALSGAGGFREYANKKKILIMRGSDRLKFNYNDVVKGKNPDQNVLLQDGDHIIVQ